MNANRLWTIGAVVIIIALLIGTWFIGISPRLSEVSTAEASKQNVAALNRSHEATLEHLKELNEKLPELQKELDELHQSIPTQAAQSDFIRAIQTAASQAGTRNLLIQFDNPVLFVPPAEPPTDPQLVAALQTVGEDKLVVVPVKFSVEGTRAQIFSIITRLQLGTRLLLVHDISFGDGYGALDSEVKASIDGQIFVYLDASLVGAVAGDGDTAVDPNAQQPE